MKISRKNFFKLAAAAPLLPAALAGQPKPKKVEKAAIKGTTDALTSFITKTELRSMPAEVVDQAKRCLVDGFGVILAGSTVKGSAIVREYVRTVSDRKEATAIGSSGFMTSAAHAALIKPNAIPWASPVCSAPSAISASAGVKSTPYATAAITIIGA